MGANKFQTTLLRSPELETRSGLEFSFRSYYLAKEPYSGGDRLDCLAQQSLCCAPIKKLNLIFAEGLQGIARKMGASKPSTNQKSGR
jgi:hypothetical protein